MQRIPNEMVPRVSKQKVTGETDMANNRIVPGKSTHYLSVLSDLSVSHPFQTTSIVTSH